MRKLSAISIGTMGWVIRLYCAVNVLILIQRLWINDYQPVVMVIGIVLLVVLFYISTALLRWGEWIRQTKVPERSGIIPVAKRDSDTTQPVIRQNSKPTTLIDLQPILDRVPTGKIVTGKAPATIQEITLNVQRGVENSWKTSKDPDRIGIWARNILNNPNGYAIIDVETTGFTPTSEIIEIAVIDPIGTVLLNQRIHPTRINHIPKGVTDRHGITIHDLLLCPKWAEMVRPFVNAVRNRTLIAYNAQFDERMLIQTCNMAGVLIPQYHWECGMNAYSEWRDEPSPRGGKKRHRLPGAIHGALGDCRALLRLIEVMAGVVLPDTLEDSSENPKVVDHLEIN